MYVPCRADKYELGEMLSFLGTNLPEEDFGTASVGICVRIPGDGDSYSEVMPIMIPN